MIKRKGSELLKKKKKKKALYLSVNVFSTKVLIGEIVESTVAANYIPARA